jgi:hypothetical protein
VRTFGTAAQVRRARSNQPLEVVVGFDSEWVDASHADNGIPPNASNRILSWQLYLVSSSGTCALLVEAKGGDKSSRRCLKTLLGMVIRKAIREGSIPSPPDVIHLGSLPGWIAALISRPLTGLPLAAISRRRIAIRSLCVLLPITGSGSLPHPSLRFSDDPAFLLELGLVNLPPRETLLGFP